MQKEMMESIVTEEEPDRSAALEASLPSELETEGRKDDSSDDVKPNTNEGYSHDAPPQFPTGQHDMMEMGATTLTGMIEAKAPTAAEENKPVTEWRTMLASPISYPPQCSLKRSSCNLKDNINGPTTKNLSSALEPSNVGTTYTYTPSFSPCQPVNKSVHGLGLTVAVERAKALARTRKKCAALLQHVATAQDSLVTSLSHSVVNQQHYQDEDKGAAPTTPRTSSGNEYHLMALQQALGQWVKQQQLESGTLKNDISKSLDEGTTYDQELSRTNWALYSSDYFSAKDACQKIHGEVKTAKKRYTKQLRDTKKELDTYYKTDVKDAAATSVEGDGTRTDDRADAKAPASDGNPSSSFTISNKSSSKPLWSALKELQEKQDLYVAKRQDEMYHIEQAYKAEHSSLEKLQGMEMERAQFFLTKLEDLLQSSRKATQASLSYHYFQEEQHRDDEGVEELPGEAHTPEKKDNVEDTPDMLTLRIVASTGGDTPWLSHSHKRGAAAASTAGRDTVGLSGVFLADNESLSPLRQRCNTAPSPSSDSASRPGTVVTLPPSPPKSPQSPTKGSWTIFSPKPEHQPLYSSSPKRSQPTKPSDEDFQSPSSSYKAEMKRSVSSASGSKKAPIPAVAVSAAVAQSIALHLPEEAGMLRDTLQEHITIRQQRLAKAKSLLQLLDVMVSAFDSYASTLRGRLAHEGYSLSSSTHSVAAAIPAPGSARSVSPTQPPRSKSPKPLPKSANSHDNHSRGTSIGSVGSTSIASATAPSPSPGERKAASSEAGGDNSPPTTTTATTSLLTTSSTIGVGTAGLEPLSKMIKSVEGPNALTCWNAALESIAQTIHASAMLTQSLRQLKTHKLQKHASTLQKNLKSFRESEDMRWKHLTEAAQLEVKAKGRLTLTSLELQRATEKMEALEIETSTSTKKSDQTAVDMNPAMRKALGSMFSILPGGGEDAMNKLLSLKQRIEIVKVTQRDLTRKSHSEKEALQKASRAKFQSFTSYTAAARTLEMSFAREEQQGWTVLVDSSKSIRHAARVYIHHRQLAIQSSFKVMGVPLVEEDQEKGGEEPIIDHIPIPTTPSNKLQQHRSGSRSSPDSKYSQASGKEADEIGLEVSLTTGFDNDGEEEKHDDNDTNEENIHDCSPTWKSIDTGNKFHTMIQSDMTLWAKNLQTTMDQHRQRALDGNTIGSTKDDVNVSSMLEADILDSKATDVVVLGGRFLLREYDTTLSSTVGEDAMEEDAGNAAHTDTGTPTKDEAESSDRAVENFSSCDSHQASALPMSSSTQQENESSTTKTKGSGTSFGEDETNIITIRTFCSLCVFDQTTARKLRQDILEKPTSTSKEWDDLAKKLHQEIKQESTAMVSAAEGGGGGAIGEKSRVSISVTQSQETSVFLQHFWTNPEDRHEDDLDDDEDNPKLPPTIIESFTCAYWPNKTDGEQSLSPLLHGRMFCTSHKLYFVGWGGKKIVLPWHQVASAYKDTTVNGMVDNALRFEIKQDTIKKKNETSEDASSSAFLSSYFFGSFVFRDKAHDLSNQLVSVSHSLQAIEKGNISSPGSPKKEKGDSSNTNEKEAKNESIKPVQPAKSKKQRQAPVKLKPVPPDPILKKMDPLISKKVSNVTVDNYYRHVWSEGNDQPPEVDAFYKPWLEDTKNHQVVVSDWEFGSFKNGWCGETYTQRRVVKYKYTRTTHLYIGPPVADITQTQYCRVEKDREEGPGDKCVLAMTVKMDGIPYADTFLVEIRWVGRRVGTNTIDLQLDAGVFIDFKKSSMFASTIRSGTIDESRPTHVNLLETIEKVVADIPPLTVQGKTIEEALEKGGAAEEEDVAISLGETKETLIRRKSKKRQASIRLKPVTPDKILKKMDPLISEKVSNVTVDNYYMHVWSEGNAQPPEIDAFYKPWLEETGNHKVTVTDWEFGSFKNSWCGETYTQRRVVKYRYTRTTHLYIGPPVADVTQTQYCRVDKGHENGPGDKCVLAMTVRMDGIPYADTFLVEIRWVGRRVGTDSNDLQLDAGVFIDFKKSSMFASKIRSGTIDESKPTHVNLLESVKKVLADIPPQQVEEFPPQELLEEESSEEEEEEEEFAVVAQQKPSKLLSPQEKIVKAFADGLEQTQQAIQSAVADPLSSPLVICLAAYIAFIVLRRLVFGKALSLPSTISNADVQILSAKMDALTHEMTVMKQQLEEILKALK
jgi:hypothetical protein